MTAIITYQLRLDEPAIFTALDGDPNSAVSYPYIPGSVIRGMVIGLFIKSNGQGFTLDAGNSNHQALFFSPSVRYLNAYPLIDGKRSLPVPATWTKPKYKKGDETDDVITDNAFRRSEHEPVSVKPKSIDGFTIINGNTAHVYQPVRVLNVHTARARRQADEQQVFRYEALAEGQAFMGAILCDTAEQAAELLKLLPENLHVALGGSRTAGYGSATLTIATKVEEWDEVAHGLDWTQPPPSEIILTFLSDALVNDGQGVFIPSPKTLEAHLLERFRIECNVEPLSLKITWIGGFNRKWGLPLPQMMAIERGSVVRLRCITEKTQGALRTLAAQGIGTRREDGFGRVVLNWQQPTQPTLTYRKYDAEPQTSANPTQEEDLSEESSKLLELFEQRIKEHTSDKLIKDILCENMYKISDGLSRTQISRLRTIIANELRAYAPGAPHRIVLSEFVNKVKGKAAGRQFDRAKIMNKSLSDWLREPFAEIRATSQDDLKRAEQEALQLVDLVLERAYRDSKQTDKPKNNNSQGEEG